MKASDLHPILEVLAWLIAALVAAVMVGWLVADANAKRIPSPSRHAKVWVCPEARDGSRVSGRFVCVLENHTYARLVVKR